MKFIARGRARSIDSVSKIGESYFNDTIRIPEFAFWVTCRSFKGERAREWLHRIALLEARDYRPPFRNEKERERETSKGIRPLRLSGMLSDGLSYKCSIENLPWVGYRRVSVTSSHEFLPHAA